MQAKEAAAREVREREESEKKRVQEEIEKLRNREVREREERERVEAAIKELQTKLATVSLCVGLVYYTSKPQRCRLPPEATTLSNDSNDRRGVERPERSVKPSNQRRRTRSLPRTPSLGTGSGRASCESARHPCSRRGGADQR